MKKLLLVAVLSRLSASAQTVQWTHSMGDLSMGWAFLGAITQDPQKNIIIGGEASDSGLRVGFISKIDTNGNKIWEYKQPDHKEMNGFNSMAVDKNGDVYAGMQRENLMYKVDKDGKLLWKKSFYTGAGRLAVQSDKNNQLIVGSSAGQYANFGNGISFTSTSTNGTCYMLKYGTDGLPVYGVQDVGGTEIKINSKGDIFSSLLLRSPFVIGTGAQTITLNAGNYILKYDSVFNLKYAVNTLTNLWTVDDFGNIYSFRWDVTDSVLRLQKWDNAGKLMWEKNETKISSYYGGIEGGAMTCNSKGDLFFTIGFTENLIIGEHTFTGKPGWNCLLAKFDSDGELKWSVQNDGGIAIGKNLWVDGSSIYLVGYGGYPSFGGKPAGDFFVTKIIDDNSNPVGVSETSPYAKQINVFPNPGSLFTVNTPMTNGTIKVINIIGETVYEKAIEGESTSLNLQHIAPGAYFLQVGTETKKIIVE